MLILSRKKDQVVVLTLPDGREVEVMVTAIRPASVSIGIHAPEDIKIKRREIAERCSEGSEQCPAA